VGRYSDFANGAQIVWHPTTGPMLIKRTIKNAWLSGGGTVGPLGYPTSDEIALGGGAAYSDFQNGVLYWDGSKMSEPLTAGLTGAQMPQALRLLLTSQGNERYLDNCQLQGVSSTGYDFQRSRNRLDKFYLDGTTVSEISDDYGLHMNLLFFAQKEGDGSTSLRMVATDHSIAVTPGILPVILGAVDAKDIRDFVEAAFVPSYSRQLIGLRIPAGVNVLSFKVLSDGGIQLYLQPGGGAPQVQQAVQSALNALVPPPPPRPHH
jgi:hypothetical protein